MNLKERAARIRGGLEHLMRDFVFLPRVAPAEKLIEDELREAVEAERRAILELAAGYLSAGGFMESPPDRVRSLMQAIKARGKTANVDRI